MKKNIRNQSKTSPGEKSLKENKPPEAAIKETKDPFSNNSSKRIEPSTNTGKSQTKQKREPEKIKSNWSSFNPGHDSHKPKPDQLKQPKAVANQIIDDVSDDTEDDEDNDELIYRDETSSQATNFASLLANSNEMSKIISRSGTNYDRLNNEETLVKSDLFQLDINKLNDALMCVNFYESLFANDKKSSQLYANDTIQANLVESRQSNVDEFCRKYQKLKPAQVTFDTHDQVEKISCDSSKNVNSSSDRGQLKDTKLELNLNVPKEQNMDDWLDELIN